MGYRMTTALEELATLRVDRKIWKRVKVTAAEDEESIKEFTERALNVALDRRKAEKVR
jgi:predicted HicB family RNase H-like nuclease